MEKDGVVVTLIYLERLKVATKGLLLPSPLNWRLMPSSKVWDDMSMSNFDFCSILGLANLETVNTMEIVLLETLQYNVRVNAAAYGIVHCLQMSLAGLFIINTVLQQLLTFFTFDKLKRN